jgi:hypothetical protein
VAPKKTTRENCEGDGKCDDHPLLEFKANLSMALLGANLLGVVMIAAMVGWSLAKSIPSMEARLTAQITPLVERLARLEQRVSSIERSYDHGQ